MTNFVPEGEAVGEGVEEPLSPAAHAEEQAQAAPDAPQAEPQVDDTDWEQVAGEYREDLQRLQAEYVNYKKRVDRDRSLSRQAGIESVLMDLVPVLDSLALAREHDDYSGATKMIADELEKIAAKHQLVGFGDVGDAFDPQLHDALMQVPLEEPVEVVTVSQVMQRGYKLGDRVIRPARVGVANP